MSVPLAAELARRQRVRDDMIKAGERQCNGCSRVLPLDQMRNGKCIDCRHLRSEQRREERQAMLAAGVRTCTKCARTQPLDQFRGAYCRERGREMWHQWYDRQGGRQQREQRHKARADRICPQCGATFTPASSNGIYCSARCKMTAWRARRRPA